jgi:hypothetical protein
VYRVSCIVYRVSCIVYSVSCMYARPPELAQVLSSSLKVCLQWNFLYFLLLLHTQLACISLIYNYGYWFGVRTGMIGLVRLQEVLLPWLVVSACVRAYGSGSTHTHTRTHVSFCALCVFMSFVAFVLIVVIFSVFCCCSFCFFVPLSVMSFFGCGGIVSNHHRTTGFFITYPDIPYSSS